MPNPTSLPLAFLATLAVTSLAAGQQPSDTAKTGRRTTRLDELVTTATRTTQTVSSNPFSVTAVTKADLATTSAATS